MWSIGLARRAPFLLLPLILSGCAFIDAPILDPDGPIAAAQRDLLLLAFALMLIVVVPVYVMAFWFLRRYRASAASPAYAPEWGYSAGIDAVIWLIPAMIVAALGYLVWTNTEKLDPYRPLGPSPLEVQVVAQDWKWLFIYPEQKIASVNELVFPSGRPLSLRITSDTVMNSLSIPGLGGQIYAMAGMETRLNLEADAPVGLTGRNTQYSGRGFADQHFAAIAMTPADFETWLAQVKQSPLALDAAAYAELAKPSSKLAPIHYSIVLPELFESIIAKYRGHH